MERDDQQSRTTFGADDDALRRDVAARIERIIGARGGADAASGGVTQELERDADSIDVTTYLLDPPASAADAARDERRARIVRIGSLAGCAVLAVVLLAPTPNLSQARHDEAAASTAARDDATPATVSADPEETDAVPRRIDTVERTPRTVVRRVDAPGNARSGRTRPRTRARVAAGGATPARGAASTTPVARPALVRPAATSARPRPAPAPAVTPSPVTTPTARPASSPSPKPDPAPAQTEAVLVPLG